MAATFVVEDGTGVAGANSYGAVADADQYHENYGDPAAWSGASTAEKQAALRAATRWLDATFMRRWKGRRADEAQPLDWPRTGASDEDGFAFEDTDMPQALLNTTYIMALEHINDSTALMKNTTSAAIKREKSKVGPLEEEIEYAPSLEPDRTIFRLALNTIAPLIEDGDRLNRG